MTHKVKGRTKYCGLLWREMSEERGGKEAPRGGMGQRREGEGGTVGCGEGLKGNQGKRGTRGGGGGSVYGSGRLVELSDLGKNRGRGSWGGNIGKGGTAQGEC